MSNGVVGAQAQPVAAPLGGAGRLGIVVLGLGLLVLTSFFVVRTFGLVQFAPFDVEEFLQKMSGLFLVTLFVERVVEVFISGWRGFKEEELKARVDTPTDGAKAAAQAELESFQRGTRRAAFSAAVLLGLAAAGLGMQALALFIDIPEFGDLPEMQRVGFTALDIVFTAGLIAGGSDGLHQLVELFVVQLRRAKERANATDTP